MDPTSANWRPPNLIGGLMRFPSRRSLSPEENQFTETLAWLIDRSPVFAREFCELVVAGDQEAQAALARARAFGARTQISLPRPDGPGYLRPDLSVVADARLLELLVEVKVGSEPHAYPHGDELLLQPDMYAQAWRGRPPATQAEVRRVGTLTNGFSFPSVAQPLRGLDVTWEQVGDLLTRLRNKECLELEVAAVAADYVALIDERILKRGAVLPEYTAQFLDAARPLVLAIATRVAASLEAAPPKTASRMKDYAGAHLYPTTPDGVSYDLWLFVTPSGGRYNRYGQSDSVGLSVEPKSGKLAEERMLAGGFDRALDLEGYHDWRQYLPLDIAEESTAVDEVLIASLVGWVDEALAACKPPLAAPPAALRTRDLSHERSERFAACLLGGAVGDALGASVEFRSLAEIREQFGEKGIVNYASAYGRVGAITDDTQMTLFTAEGLLRAHNRWLGKGICHVPSVVRHAYLRWLHTQGEQLDENPFLGGSTSWPDGWLIGIGTLYARRAPGNTCLAALHETRLGSPSEPLNDSKGCGAVMRVAPVGLFTRPEQAFELGCEVGAITHGHPSGYLAAGFLASLIARLVADTGFETAIDLAVSELRAWDGHDECLAAVEQARRLAAEGSPSPARVESLGEGWVAEEALAIAVYCALTAESFAEGVRLAVNHSGDSDSTGTIAGNILGVLHGKSSIPKQWLDQLELRNEIEEIAVDLAQHLEPLAPSEHPFDIPIPDWDRYPGW